MNKNLALGGIFTGMIIVLLLLTYVLPVMDLTMLAASFFVLYTYAQMAGARFGLISYAATSGLCLILFGGLPIIPIIFIGFGLYWIIKPRLDKLQLVPQYALKLIILNAALAAMAYFFGSLLLAGVEYPWYIIAGMAQILFIGYDYVIPRLYYRISPIINKVKN